MVSRTGGVVGFVVKAEDVGETWAKCRGQAAAVRQLVGGEIRKTVKQRLYDGTMGFCPS